MLIQIFAFMCRIKNKSSGWADSSTAAAAALSCQYLRLRKRRLTIMCHVSIPGWVVAEYGGSWQRQREHAKFISFHFRVLYSSLTDLYVYHCQLQFWFSTFFTLFHFHLLRCLILLFFLFILPKWKVVAQGKSFFNCSLKKYIYFQLHQKLWVMFTQ